MLLPACALESADAPDDAKLLDLDMDRLYANYLVTCRMSGVEPVPRERAEGLIAEWGEVLSGRPDPHPFLPSVSAPHFSLGRRRIVK